MNINDFVAEFRGYSIDFDGYYGAQCVDLVQLWNSYLGDGRLSGNAVDLAGQIHGGFFRWIENTPDGVPRPGDIMVWGPYAPFGIGQYGHTSIFVQGDVNSFTSFDQNWPTGHVADLVHHANYGGVVGWLQPVSLDPVAPAPAPVAPPSEPAPSAPQPPAPAPEIPAPIVPSQPDTAPSADNTSAPVDPATPVQQPAATPAPDAIVVEPTKEPSSLTPPSNNNIIVNVEKEIKKLMFKEKLLQNLVSKKLWAAVAVIVPLLLAHQWDAAVTALFGYLGAQGIVDFKQK